MTDLPDVPDHVPAYPFWAAPRLDRVPMRWRDTMAAEWRRMAAKERGAADSWLKDRLAEVEAGQRAGVNPAMDDSALCKLADEEARTYADLMAKYDGKADKAWRRRADAWVARPWAPVLRLRWKAGKAQAMMCKAGIADLWPDGPTMTLAGRLQRLKSPEFWRKVFRRVHARTVERCAIALGFVRADRDCYASKESRAMVRQREAANAAMLAHTLAVSEYGQEMTLAEVAERSVSNPTIRRGELMTRVSGFEACADALGHVKRWAVLTCPSRMHRWTKLDGGKCVPNKRYDGTGTREAQDYLAGQWRRLCAWYERQGLRLYGFRTTEPHHDSTPHWNVLAFFAPLTERRELKTKCLIPVDAVGVFDRGLRRYFLENDSATERGAAEHRVKIEAIDSSKGSAAAYIAKYISKGIDGHGMEVDLYGNPIHEAAPAVIAWARVWGIRQFQQIGGPPVTVWRELRRLHPENTGCEQTTPDTLTQALRAVNLALIEPGERKSLAWQRYTMGQGGPTCKRAAWRVRLHREDREGANRYGEPMAARVLGVVAVGRVLVPAAAVGGMAGVMGRTFTRAATVAHESERCEWLVIGKRDADDAYLEHCRRLGAQLAAMDAADAARIEAIQKRTEDGERLREALPPWTRVNNCTAPSATPVLDSLDRRYMDTGPSPFRPLRGRRRKVGRFFNWAKVAGGSSEGVEHGTDDQAA